jgi:16S rRNA (cytidine1402-2'-O)-methyltransferase
MPMLPAGLYVVATPIGNLEDLSPRAVNILQIVNLVLAEDSRHSGKLLKHYGIHSPVLAYHDHNERQLVPEVIEKIHAGQSVALISDAGTPLISDPGYRLVAAVHAEGLNIIPVPGPCALICALSVSGLPTDRFVFEGFLPSKQHARQHRLSELAAENRTLVFYEVPHRICSCMQDMIGSFGTNRSATLAKELTKKFEMIRRDTLGNLLNWLLDDPLRQKGEFVLLVQGNSNTGVSNAEAIRVLDILLPTLSVKDAVNIAAEILRYNKNHLYQLALELTGKKDEDSG